MTDPADKFLRDLDISVFEGIPSQTSPDDRRSLLALQGGVKAKCHSYTYLEIGSFLGGSLQPYLWDPGCAQIYSIDKRCVIAPDDRDETSTVVYENNTSENMLELLGKVNEAGVRKIICFEGDAVDLDVRKISSPPAFAFIDGEHTHSAVLSDFDFCSQVVAPDGLIAFHDSYIIYPAVEEICRKLKRRGRPFRFWKLAGSVSVVSFDPRFVTRAPYIQSLLRQNRAAWARFCARQQVKKVIPRPAFQMLKRAFAGSHRS
jgi:hypothetical protein